MCISSPQVVTSVLGFMRKQQLTDVTISAEGKSIKAHRLILAAASKYFKVREWKGRTGPS